jgi:hypothetical protein
MSSNPRYVRNLWCCKRQLTRLACGPKRIFVFMERDTRLGMANDIGEWENLYANCESVENIMLQRDAYGVYLVSGNSNNDL